jgi:hypothetical protein
MMPRPGTGPRPGGWETLLYNIVQHFFILIPCIIEYAEIDQEMHWVAYFFIYTMARTCFGKAMPSSGRDWVPSELLQRQYGRSLLPYWRWNSSERNLVAPWWWHCLAETCRSHRINKEVYNSVHLLVNSAYSIMHGIRIKKCVCMWVCGWTIWSSRSFVPPYTNGSDYISVLFNFFAVSNKAIVNARV